MIQKRKFLVLIPFDEILTEYSQFDNYLWFYDKGLKTVIESIMLNLDAIEHTPFHDIDLVSLETELYGTSLSNNVQNDYNDALEALDRCNIPTQELEKDMYIIDLMISDLVNDIEKFLRQNFNKTNVWHLDFHSKPIWRGNNLLLSVKI